MKIRKLITTGLVLAVPALATADGPTPDPDFPSVQQLRVDAQTAGQQFSFQFGKYQILVNLTQPMDKKLPSVILPAELKKGLTEESAKAIAIEFDKVIQALKQLKAGDEIAVKGPHGVYAPINNREIVRQFTTLAAKIRAGLTPEAIEAAKRIEDSIDAKVDGTGNVGSSEQLAADLNTLGRALSSMGVVKFRGDNTPIYVGTTAAQKSLSEKTGVSFSSGGIFRD